MKLKNPYLRKPNLPYSQVQSITITTKDQSHPVKCAVAVEFLPLMRRCKMNLVNKYTMKKMKL